MFEMYACVNVCVCVYSPASMTNDALCRHRASAQRPIINLIGNIVTRYTWTLESFRL